MVRELDYNTVSDVLLSWEQLRRVKNFEEEAGTRLFQILFKDCPEAKVLFGFPITMDPDSSELLTSKRFKLHGVYLIQMLDSALNLLGPDIELLTEIMTEMGKKHIRYGVKPAYFPLMGEALIKTLEEMLGKEKFSNAVVESWRETYDALADCMIESMENNA